MSTHVDMDKDDYVVHVRVRIPMRAVRYALEVNGVDIGDAIYEAVRDRMAMVDGDVAVKRIGKTIVPRRQSAGIVNNTKRKIRLDD